MTDRRASDPQINVRVTPELIERMNTACAARLIGRRLLVERALSDLLDRLEADDG